MLKNAFIKDVFRDIKKSKRRFLSIFAIIALGVAFFLVSKYHQLINKNRMEN
ncbi:hypothetical protein ACH36K_10955 [Clostridium sp. MB05]|jgi:hypothetical protein|uniref:hypothetical protein n=1 Tax=Clostridium sp. MB05 TaxID=3376682 RepID=UPI0039819F22